MVACCQIMVGYLPVLVGPLNLNSDHMYVPVAITEHHQRLEQGVEWWHDGMTRSPVVRFTTLTPSNSILTQPQGLPGCRGSTPKSSLPSTGCWKSSQTCPPTGSWVGWISMKREEDQEDDDQAGRQDWWAEIQRLMAGRGGGVLEMLTRESFLLESRQSMIKIKHNQMSKVLFISIQFSNLVLFEHFWNVVSS